jgi:hypothetical protein
VAAVLVTGSVAGRRHSSQLEDAQSEVRAARELLGREVARSKQIALSVSLREDSATRALQRAEAASASARTAESRAKVARARFDSLSSVASPVCDSIVAAGHTALSESDSVNRALASDTTELRSVIALKQRSIDELRPQLDSLRNAAVRVGDASQKVIDVSQPSLLSRLLPHTGAGVTAGVDVHGRPNAVAGITFGWTF